MACSAGGEIDAHTWHVELVAPRLAGAMPQYQSLTIRQVGHLAGNLWEQLELPWFARGRLLFDPSNTGPVLKGFQAVNLHDASVFAVPGSYSFAFRMKYRLILSVLSRSAMPILTDSEFSRGELVKYCRANRDRIQVVPLAGDHLLNTPTDDTVFAEQGIGLAPYFLAVGSNAPHKNLVILAQAMSMLPDPGFEMVVAGGDYHKIFRASGLDSQESIKRLGYVSEGELKALYQRATALVFPSLYEGFGLPPLEAMACGCPVICARAASLPEVCGDAALYFDPRNPRDLADKIHAFIQDPGLAAGLRERGFRQAKRFSWLETGRQTWAALTSRLAQPLP